MRNYSPIRIRCHDAACDLQHRTRESNVATLAVTSLNQMTSVSRTAFTVLAGVAWAPATNVSLSDGSNSFTAIALENLGRTDTNTVSAWLPAAAAMKYDLNGNLTNDSRRVLIYDDENQLTTLIVTNASGTITKSEFTYDGKMRRRLRREYNWQSAIGDWQCTLEVRYVYDGMLVVQERPYNPQLSTNSPQQLVTYTRGRDLSGTLEGAGGIGGLLARSEVPSSILQLPSSPLHALYHADGNGNVTCLIGTNSIVLARYLYDPYGSLLSQSGSLADANLYRFSSKEWHGASGLVYYGYRFYAPGWQRWLNRDPSGEKSGINLCEFVANNPISCLDAVGLTIYKCTRDADILGGQTGLQHVYLWDDTTKTSCGEGGGMWKQRGTSHPKDKPPGTKGVKCVPVPSSEGKEAAVMACCFKKTTYGWIFFGNDCHVYPKDCLRANDLPDPDIYGKWIPGLIRHHIEGIESEGGTVEIKSYTTR